jgi:hypothetical protein
LRDSAGHRSYNPSRKEPARMLTVLDALSVAGSRAKHNDDAFGVTERRAFVLDGATDLHEPPVMDAASDAGWIARFAANVFSQADHLDARAAIRLAIVRARAAFEQRAPQPLPAQWSWPITTALLVTQTADGVEIADLGDSCCFTLSADGEAGRHGGNPTGRKEEAAAAAAKAQTSTASGDFYKSDEALALLRADRARFYAPGPPAALGIAPASADIVRVKPVALQRTAYALLCTDGFSALSDVYGAYDPAGLILAARDRGLAALAQELRAIETEDREGKAHPRWKRSDDATALLIRID